jgi:site-specific DNA-cytosine methylase
MMNDQTVFHDHGFMVIKEEPGTAGTLVGRDSKATRHFIVEPSKEGTQMMIRRLTPLEFERLMGWDDNHTLYRADGGTTADTQRFKMCGNGVVAPVATWIAEQITPLLRTDNA